MPNALARTRGSSRRLIAAGTALAAIAATVSTVVAPSAAHAVAPGVITSTGPLTTIGITPDLKCSTNRTGDSAGEWYSDTDCGTFAVVNGALYGPAAMDSPGSYYATSAETAAWTPVSQSAATGAGTVTSPYIITTTVRAGATGVTLTETDTYVTGQEGYASYFAVGNTTAAPVSIRLYHAGDCFLQDSDYGFGVVDASTGSAGCQAEVTPEASPSSHVRGPRVEQMFPLTPGSAYIEAQYAAVWEAVGSKLGLPNTCRCSDDATLDYIDNGVGLSWDTPALAAGGTVQQGVYTSLSPTGIIPATTGNTADAPTVLVSHNGGYTVTVHNTGASAIHLVGVNDVLPAGFTYVPGSTTGLVTTNPTVNGQTLTWSVPSTVIAAHGTASLHFGFVASATPGNYFNSASGVSTETVVVPAGPFAPLAVITTSAAPSPVSALGGIGKATVQWTAPVNNGNSVITAYDVLLTPAGGTASQTTVAGTATSSLLTGLVQGKDYIVQVRADNAAGVGAWSAPVALGGVKLTNGPVNTKLTYGASRTLKVTVKSDGHPVAGAQLKLMSRAKSKHVWSVAGHAVTKANGVASVKVKPARGTVYEWVFSGDPAHTGATVDRAVTVAPAVTITVTGKGTVQRGAAATASGKVSPAFRGQFIYLQKLVGKHWVTVGSAKLGKSGHYVFGLSTTTRGVFVYRVAKGHSGDYVTGFSATKTLHVK